MKNKSQIAVLSVLVVFLITVTAVAQQKQNLELTADELLIDDANSEVTATGNVRFSQANIKLNTDKLIATEELKIIEAVGDVVVSQLERTLTAHHLKLNTQTEIGILTGEAKYQAPDMVIRGKKFNFNLKTGHLIVEEEVYLKNKEEEITAEAKKLSYSSTKQEAVLTGDVVAEKGDRRMTAEKMTIDLETNKIKAEGQTTLIVPNAQQKQGDKNGD